MVLPCPKLSSLTIKAGPRPLRTRTNPNQNQHTLLLSLRHHLQTLLAIQLLQTPIQTHNNYQPTPWVTEYISLHLVPPAPPTPTLRMIVLPTALLAPRLPSPTVLRSPSLPLSRIPLPKTLLAPRLLPTRTVLSSKPLLPRDLPTRRLPSLRTTHTLELLPFTIIPTSGALLTRARRSLKLLPLRYLRLTARPMA